MVGLIMEGRQLETLTPAICFTFKKYEGGFYVSNKSNESELVCLRACKFGIMVSNSLPARLAAQSV